MEERFLSQKLYAENISAVEKLGNRNAAVKGCSVVSLQRNRSSCRGAVLMQGSSGGGEKRCGCREAVWLRSVVAEKRCHQDRDAAVITLSKSGMNCPFVENC